MRLPIRELKELFSKLGFETKEKDEEIQYCNRLNLEDNPLIKLRREGKIKCIISRANN